MLFWPVPGTPASADTGATSRHSLYTLSNNNNNNNGLRIRGRVLQNAARRVLKIGIFWHVTSFRQIEITYVSEEPSVTICSES